VGSARAEQPAPPRNAQLDRIEQKLDDVFEAPRRRRRAARSNGKNARVGKPRELSARRAGDCPRGARVGAASFRDSVDSVGGFTYSGGPIALHDLVSRGVNFSGLSGIVLQGWLKVKQAGRMQFVADLHGTLAPNVFVPPECLLQIWLEDRLVGPNARPSRRIRTATPRRRC